MIKSAQKDLQIDTFGLKTLKADNELTETVSKYLINCNFTTPRETVRIDLYLYKFVCLFKKKKKKTSFR